MLEESSHYCVQIMMSMIREVSLDTPKKHSTVASFTLRKKIKLKHFKRKKVNTSKGIFWFYTFSLKLLLSFVFAELFSFFLLLLLLLRIPLQKLLILMNILSTHFALANIFIHQATSSTCTQS